jgi:sugar lactone lactonase YvrE
MNARWIPNGNTVAGGNGSDKGLNQLYHPWGLYVDDDETIYIADCVNDRIVEWKRDATGGIIVAGGRGPGNLDSQLNRPIDVIVDKDTDSLIICDNKNRRVVRWPRQNGTSGQTIISDIGCS